MKTAAGSSSSSMWNPMIGSSSSDFTNQAPPSQLNEEDLERQYASYKAQFEEWIEKNKNHPDRDAYNRYIKQFRDWEAQVENSRRALRQWKASKPNEAPIGAGDIVNSQNGAAHGSETSSPSQSATSKDKKKKKKKAKKDGAAAVNADDNPMMTMMKMMTAMAATTAAASAPAPAPTPMDPMSMMMAMTMMMPMIMGAAPTPPAIPGSASIPAITAPSSKVMDISKPPPMFPTDRPDRYQQVDRDREFRAERSRYAMEPQPRARLDRSPIRYDQHADRRRGYDADQAREMDRGDFWYQRWLASKQRQPPPAAAATMSDPWVPSVPHPRPAAPYSQRPTPAATQSGPIPLWEVRPQPSRLALDRDPYADRVGDVPYYSRSSLGARDFSMRKPNSRWD